MTATTHHRMIDRYEQRKRQAYKDRRSVQLSVTPTQARAALHELLRAEANLPANPQGIATPLAYFARELAAALAGASPERLA